MIIKIHYPDDKIKLHKGMVCAGFDSPFLKFSKSTLPDSRHKTYIVIDFAIRYAVIEAELKNLIVEIHYYNNEVETHRGIKHIFFQKGRIAFSKSSNIKSSRYRISWLEYWHVIVKEEESDGGSKNKD